MMVMLCVHTPPPPFPKILSELIVFDLMQFGPLHVDWLFIEYHNCDECWQIDITICVLFF